MRNRMTIEKRAGELAFVKLNYNRYARTFFLLVFRLSPFPSLPPTLKHIRARARAHTIQYVGIHHALTTFSSVHVIRAITRLIQ